MNKNSLIAIIILFPFFSFATSRTWNGSVNNSWIVANNWTPAGIPVTGADDITFDGGATPTVTITDVPAFTSAQSFGLFSAINNVTVNLSSASPTYLLFSTSLFILTGSRVNIGASTTTLFVFGGNSTNNLSTQIDGTLDLQGTGITNQKSYYVYNGTTINAVARVTGKIILSGTFATITNANNTNLNFESGSSLDITRDGGSIPEANFKDGSTITVSGVVNSSTTLNSNALFNGLIIWNCPLQTISGLSAILLPTTSSTVDSIRIVSTGTGTVRLTTEPNGYHIGQLEVQGGTLEMGAPITQNGTGTINTDLNINTTGTVIGNATFIGDIGSVFAVTVTVNGYVTVTGGGTFNLTNRPVASLTGAFQLNAKSNVVQTGGTITASSTFGSQNQINMAGTALQNLELDNITGPVNLVINNTSGVSLQNNMTLPSALVLQSGYLQLNNFTTSLVYPLIFPSANTKVVTNLAGVLKVTAMPAGGSLLFPVAPSSTTYNPVTIAPLAGAVSNDYSVRVETGNTPGGIYNTTRTINCTWTITPTSNINSGTVNLTFQYAASDANGACIPTNPMELGHFIPGTPGSWNIDPAGSTVPAGGDPYTAGTYAPGSLGSSFVLGNVGAILAFDKLIDLSAQKQLNKTHLMWTINNAINVKSTEVQRSADGRNFTTLTSVGTAVNAFDDDKLLPGLNYYRIKITDLNGKITYSTMVAILNKESGFDIVGLMPTVVTNDAILNVTAAQKTKMDVLVTDVSGRQVQKISYNLIAGSNQFTINLAKLGTGMYQITGYTTDGVSRTIRFVKQ